MESFELDVNLGSRTQRRGFGLVEVLISLAISATLLTSIMMSLNASFAAYQKTTEAASQHTVTRLTAHRLMSLFRTGREFGPFPGNVVTTPVITSDYVEFLSTTGDVMLIEFDEETTSLYLTVDPDGGGSPSLLIAGVEPQYDEDGERIKPFTLEYEVGPSLYRASMDIVVGEDPNVRLAIEGSGNVEPLRIVASSSPRNYDGD